MRRKEFIQQSSLLAAGIFTARHLPEAAWSGIDKKIKGRVVSGSRGLAGVVVSDGYSVVVTDAKGKYSFEPNPAAQHIFIATPAGYAFVNENGIARQYKVLEDIKETSFDFELTPLAQNDNEHQFIIWADPQVKNDSDVQKMMTSSVPDVQKFVAAAGANTLLHGITVGDIVWDEHKYYASYDKAVAQMGIPFFQCLGNHDMDYVGDDDTSDTTFRKTYGPTYYSFNRGQVHYIVMDNVRYLGKEREYDGFVSQKQLDWLQKDLSYVGKDKLVVLCLHIPVHNGVENNKELYAVLADRKVHIMSGHTHYHRNVITGNIYEHNHGTVCGAWWTGPICGDGTPCGYGIYKVKGNELEWHYQSTGESADHQLKIFIDKKDANEQLMQVNIWNHDPAWKTEYTIDGINKGALQQFDGFDPLAYSSLLGPDLPKTRGFAEPRKTEHMFKAVIPATAREVTVIATDRFGKRYSATHKI